MHKIFQILKKYKIELLIFTLAIIFSSWLMFSSFSYNGGGMLISQKSWSDFASHVPLIRSFSLGNNFPPEYPLFSGPPIRYHFLFYAFVGMLEKTGLRIDYALNIPSILGFSFLLLMIYIFSKEVFKSKLVGLLSIILFLFNGSLSFIKYFLESNLSKETLINLINSNKFVSFGPYDGSIISAFWNLNIYTNQRHLAFSYALSLFIVYFFIKLEKNNKNNYKKSILIGFILGISFLLNMAVFLMTVIILSCMFLLFDKKRLYISISIVLSGIIALPQYLYMQSAMTLSILSIIPGYLVENLNFFNFLNYWFQNLGLHLMLIPLAFLLVDKQKRNILLSFFALFLVGNLIEFSPEIAANHKFFNLFMIVGAMYSSYVIVLMWNKKIILKFFSVLIFIFLILSGIMDFFPILNDKKINLSDYPVNKDIRWIMKNTKPDSTFLNTNYLYDNASLAGRKIFLGWPYFSWSQGYDTLTRDNLRKSLLNTNDLKFFCDTSLKNDLAYLEVYSLSDVSINTSFLRKSLQLLYENKSSNYFVYDINKSCR